MKEGVLLALIGLLSGICASLGLGGGFILLLYLTAAASMDQMEAQLFNLLFFLPIAAFSLLFHQKNGLVNWKIVRPAAAGGLLGVLAGVWAASALSGERLSRLFAVLVLLIGIREVFAGKKKDGARRADAGPPAP